MTEIIIILGLIVTIGAGLLYKSRRDNQAGVTKERLHHVEKEVEILIDENEHLSNRPRNTAEYIKRLQQWKDRVSGK